MMEIPAKIPSPMGRTDSFLPGIANGAAELEAAASAESAAEVPEAEPLAEALVGVPEPAAAAAATGDEAGEADC